MLSGEQVSGNIRQRWAACHWLRRPSPTCHVASVYTIRCRSLNKHFNELELEIQLEALKPAIVLVEPKMGENIGAAARAMKNFGLSDLRLVKPFDGWPNPLADMMASHAVDLLRSARLYDNVEEAIADLDRVYAATARTRFMSKAFVTSRQLPGDLRQLAVAATEAARAVQEAAATATSDIVAAYPAEPLPYHPQACGSGVPSLHAVPSMTQCTETTAFAVAATPAVDRPSSSHASSTMPDTSQTRASISSFPAALPGPAAAQSSNTCSTMDGQLVHSAFFESPNEVANLWPAAPGLPWGYGPQTSSPSMPPSPSPPSASASASPARASPPSLCASAAIRMPRAGVLFGREASGLTNEEVAAANKVLAIEAHPDYPVLNLAQAVVCTAYELHNARLELAETSVEKSIAHAANTTMANGESVESVGATPSALNTTTTAAAAATTLAGGTSGSSNITTGVTVTVSSSVDSLRSRAEAVQLATRGDVDNFFRRLVAELDGADFFESAAKRPATLLSIRNLAAKVEGLTVSEVALLHGILTKLRMAA